VTATLVLVLVLAGVDEARARPFESPAEAVPRGRIDELVFARLKELGIAPAHLCSDEVFVRRVYLDVLGTLPTAQEARRFLTDRDPAKRRALIDDLLRRPEFADYWALKWGDVLRIKAEFPINLWPKAAEAYHRWVRTCIRENMPYDRFVREMLTASGSNFRVPQVNFYRAMQAKEAEAIARSVALSFMGTRAEKWPQEQLAGMAGFFQYLGYKSTNEWKEEIILFDLGRSLEDAAAGRVATAILPDGTAVQLSAEQDPRRVFADWLIDGRNPWFGKNIVNRIWSWLLGRGIIHEPDDIRPDNRPVNGPLLTCLEQELVAARYDLKHIYRLILNSTTYQLSSIARSDRPEGRENFASYPLRRLEAEVLVDALCQVTGTSESYTSSIPEPYSFIPEDLRSIALPDGSITSLFLELFGRPARDTGLESERNNRVSAAQRLHMLNSSHVRRKLEESPKLRQLLQPGNPRETLTGLYLTILSRWPVEEEMRIVGDYAQAETVGRREVFLDLAWALINSMEFQYRH